MGVYNCFKYGTKTKPFHENWYPAQPGHPACPVRLLLQGIAAYDRQMVALHGRRLSVEDPLFTPDPSARVRGSRPTSCRALLERS